MVWLSVLGLLCGPVSTAASDETPRPLADAAQVSTPPPLPPLRDAAPQDTSGALLFLRHSNKLVSLHTESSVTHVGVILRQGGVSWVYEATPAQVRRRVLPHYLTELSRLNEGRRIPMEAWVLAPRDPLAAGQTDAMAAYLESQLGRVYSVRGFVRREPSEGVHCAELAAATLNLASPSCFAECHRLTPNDVLAGVAGRYCLPVRLTLPELPKRTWRQRTAARWQGVAEWCGWVGGESLQLVSD